MRILLYDTEISPMLAWAYEMYDANIIKVEREPLLLCFSYQWYGDPGGPWSFAMSDFSTYRKDPHNDIHVVESLHVLLDSADIVVAHNAHGFDNKIANSRFLAHGMKPPSPYRTVDTLRSARKFFRFGNNSLQSLCTRFGIGSKPMETHSDLWYDAYVNRDEVAWKKLKDYCKNDVTLLLGLYNKLRPYIDNHPAVILGDCCPRCGSTNVVYRGYRYTNTRAYRRVRCKDCGAWSRERLSDKEVEPPTFTNIGG